MDTLRNIVILKDLPSNVIEEAFVVLKKNHKARKLEHIDKKDFCGEKSGNDDNDFIVREAELLISSYIESADDETNNSNLANNNLNKKYKRLKRLVIFLGCCLIFALIYIIR